MCTASGQSAVFYAMLNILEAGDHFISSSYVYGGSYNLFAHTFKKNGYRSDFCRSRFTTLKSSKKAIRPNTKAVFAETIANPALRVLDIEKFTALAKAAEAPLLIDNTFATPYFCRPIEFGANVVIHSTSKILRWSCYCPWWCNYRRW